MKEKCNLGPLDLFQGLVIKVNDQWHWLCFSRARLIMWLHSYIHYNFFVRQLTVFHTSHPMWVKSRIIRNAASGNAYCLVSCFVFGSLKYQFTVLKVINVSFAVSVPKTWVYERPYQTVKFILGYSYWGSRTLQSWASLFLFSVNF